MWELRREIVDFALQESGKFQGQKLTHRLVSVFGLRYVYAYTCILYA